MLCEEQPTRLPCFVSGGADLGDEAVHLCFEAFGLFEQVAGGGENLGFLVAGGDHRREPRVVRQIVRPGALSRRE